MLSMELDQKLDETEKKGNKNAPKKIQKYIFIIATWIILSVIAAFFIMSIKDEDNLTPFEKYIKAEKYLYVMDEFTPSDILKLCESHNFKRVYLSIGIIGEYWDEYYSKGEFPPEKNGSIGYKAFIKQLNNISVEVELVTVLEKNPEDFSKMDRVKTVANMVKSLAQEVKIKSLHFDQEPINNSSYESLLKMYEMANEIFPTSAIVLPFWLDLKMEDLRESFKDEAFYNKFRSNSTLVDAIMNVTNLTDLMAYDQNYTEVKKILEKYKNITERHPHNEAKYIIEISGETNITQRQSLHQRFIEDRDTFFNFIYDSYKEYGPLTIQYDEVWYKSLYCKWPNESIPFDGNMPKNCT